MKEKYHFVYLLPFFIAAILITVRFIQPGYDESVRSDSSAFNQLGYGSVYILSAILLTRNYSLWQPVARNSITFTLLLGMIFLSILWSYYPTKVIVSFVHQVGIAAVAVCAVIYINKAPIGFFRHVQSYILIYMLITIIVTYLNPDIGLMEKKEWKAGTAGRWRGLTFHANSLGQVCVVGIWSGVSLWLLGFKSNRWLIIVFLNTALCFFVLVKTNSVTSLIVSLFVLINSIYFKRTYRIGPRGRLLKYWLFIFLPTSTILFTFLFAGPDSVISVFSFFGREVTFTGRLYLWELGFDGFSEKPLFGWGYDGLRSFLTSYTLRGFDYTQLHNGYLDLLVRGGAVSLVLVFILVVRVFAVAVKRSRTLHPRITISFTTLVWAILVMNFTEALLVRNMSLMWLLFLICYFFIVSNMPNEWSRNKK